MSRLPKAISRAAVQDLATQYSQYVPSSLKELDAFRYEELPGEIAKRRKVSRKSKPVDPLISKDELVKLVEWKLKHGTFRPKLLQLVKSNDAAEIAEIFLDLNLDTGNAKTNMTCLCKLKGIGPATASLVLSCLAPTSYPFFSDELFRWLHWDGKNADGTIAGIKPGTGWSRSIGYTQREYDSLLSKATQLQQRLSAADEASLSFLDLEKAAWSLKRGGGNMDGEGTDEAARPAKRKIDSRLDGESEVDSKARKQSPNPTEGAAKTVGKTSTAKTAAGSRPSRSRGG